MDGSTVGNYVNGPEALGSAHLAGFNLPAWVCLPTGNATAAGRTGRSRAAGLPRHLSETQRAVGSRKECDYV
jgi:hypothetical protein